MHAKRSLNEVIAVSFVLQSVTAPEKGGRVTFAMVVTVAISVTNGIFVLKGGGFSFLKTLLANHIQNYPGETKQNKTKTSKQTNKQTNKKMRQNKNKTRRKKRKKERKKQKQKEKIRVIFGSLVLVFGQWLHLGIPLGTTKQFSRIPPSSFNSATQTGFGPLLHSTSAHSRKNLGKSQTAILS